MTKEDVVRSLNFGQRVAEDELDALDTYFVETDPWRRLYSGEVDVIYGPKGSGKSALYSLLLARVDEMFDRRVVLVAAENPRGTPAFRDLVIDPPASEPEFIALWKLYFVALISGVFDELGVGGKEAAELRSMLEREGLARGKRTLQAVLKSAFDYVRGAFRPASVEGTINIDPASGLPRGFGGRITFREPTSTGPGSGLSSVDTLLRLADTALAANADFSVWILLDRLDVAFTESQELEHNALRALFRVYLDLLGFARIRLKIFLRTDIWKRLTAGGFREASHVTRNMTINWNRSSLLNLVVRRVVQNALLQEFYAVSPPKVLESAQAQERLFYRMFPDQVDVGPNKPKAFDWLLARTRDGSGQTAPRELIHVLNSLRDVQVRRLEIGESDPEGEQLFVRGAFKEALPEVSQVRLQQTLYAEYPGLRETLEKLRGAKTRHTPETLASRWGASVETARDLAKQLVDVGFFEQQGSHEKPEYWIPFLYRDGLDLVQGTAEEDEAGQQNA